MTPSPASPPRTVPAAFAARRRALLARFPSPALFAAGRPPSRNFPANQYAFRASSHFLYFTGAPIPGAALLFAEGKATLFAEPPDPEDALWHGPRPALADVREALALDAVRPIGELDAALASLPAPATLPPTDEPTAAWVSARLGRSVTAGGGAALAPGTPDEALADAVIAIRLQHDAAAVDQLRAVAALSAEAHVAGMRATPRARTEAEVAGAMIGALRARGLDESYEPIVTVHGEVLHIRGHENPLQPGDLILADVGGETPEGWAGDVTRVWPVTGTFSPTQRALYEVVLAANEAAIAAVRPGNSYRAIHETAKRTIVEGLRALGILRGEVDGLLERGAAAVFFPHGVGHLLGLDVHDMEDLGDRHLRLDRALAPGMTVPIEPGFYQLPAILADPTLTGPLGADLDRATLSRFSDVRGIRIEDDVLCTEGEPEVMTRSAPKTVKAVEATMAG